VGEPEEGDGDRPAGGEPRLSHDVAARGFPRQRRDRRRIPRGTRGGRRGEPHDHPLREGAQPRRGRRKAPALRGPHPRAPKARALRGLTRGGGAGAELSRTPPEKLPGSFSRGARCPGRRRQYRVARPRASDSTACRGTEVPSASSGAPGPPEARAAVTRCLRSLCGGARGRPGTARRHPRSPPELLGSGEVHRRVSPSRSREEAPSFAGSSIFSWSRPTKRRSSSDSMDRRAQNIGIRWRSVSKRWKRARPARW